MPVFVERFGFFRVDVRCQHDDAVSSGELLMVAFRDCQTAGIGIPEELVIETCILRNYRNSILCGNYQLAAHIINGTIKEVTDFTTLDALPLVARAEMETTLTVAGFSLFSSSETHSAEDSIFKQFICTHTRTWI